MINNKNNDNHMKYDADVYSIQCLGCSRKYVGEFYDQSKTYK